MADVAAEQASSGHQPVKRKRGRPRKLKSDQSEDPKPKRPRGRPKGSKNKRPSKFKKILRPIKYESLLRVKKNTANCKKSQHKQLKRNSQNLHASLPQLIQNVEAKASNIPYRIKGKFAKKKTIENSPTHQIISQKEQSSVISSHSKKITECFADSRNVKRSVNNKCQIHNECNNSTKKTHKQLSKNNKCQRTKSGLKNSAILNQLPTPVNYRRNRRKSCGLCDQASVRRYNILSKHFCNEPVPTKCSQSSSRLRRSLRIKYICDKFSNSTTSAENPSVYNSSSKYFMPLQNSQNSRNVRPHHSLLPNVSEPHSSLHHSRATVNTTALSSHTIATTHPSTVSSSLSPVSTASTNNLHKSPSLSSHSTLNCSPCEFKTDSFTSTSQSKDVTDVDIVRPSNQLPSNTSSLKVLKCQKAHPLAASLRDGPATNAVQRHCYTTNHLHGKCHSMHMNTQQCLPNIRSAVQVAASMISSSISDKGVSIYNHALEKQSGSVCQSYEQFNIVLSPFEKQIFELHRQEHEQRMAMEQERHQLKMDIMRLKKDVLERKLKGKN